MAKRNGSLHVAKIARIHNGKVYYTYLLRRSYRQDGKVKHQTLGNISHLPPDLIELVTRRLQGELVGDSKSFKVVRNLPHGHVAAVLGTLRNCGLEQVISSRDGRQRRLVIAMLVERILRPGSKLATLRSLQRTTATSTLGLELGLADVQQRELYEALDWLLKRQRRIENKLARRHLQDGTLVLYDVSSSYYTGQHCSLAKFGYNRDGKKDFPQIVYGLLCNAEGCPVAIEVFSGNTADSQTLAAQVDKLRKRFGIQRVVLVGDRGMITSARIEKDLRPIKGLDWITALRADSIRKLASQGVIQPSLFDERELAEVESPDYPGERLIVCRNPFLAEERARQREELLQATERDLEKIEQAVQREKRPLRGKDKIALRVGKVLDRHKVGKHFLLEIEDDKFSYRRNEAKIAEEAALDGLYVLRTSVKKEQLSAGDTVLSYKRLSRVERAFRSLKTVDLKLRPIYHWLDDRVRAHVFLCMLAYYVEWHMRQKLAPILFDDDQRQAAAAERSSPVAPAQPSASARRKAGSKKTPDGETVQSFQDVLNLLATINRNWVRVCEEPAVEIDHLTQPTPQQQKILDLLGVSLEL